MAWCPTAQDSVVAAAQRATRRTPCNPDARGEWEALRQARDETFPTMAHRPSTGRGRRETEAEEEKGKAPACVTDGGEHP